MKKIKVLLADDHQMFLDGMKLYLEGHDDIEIVGEAGNGNEVIDYMEKNNGDVDIVVLDIDMPELDGLDTCKFLRKKYENTQVLILSMFGSKEFIIKLIKYGAAGYILKNKTKEELLMAIHNVAAGRTHYGLEIMKHAISVNNSEENEEIKLTDREIEVLKQVAEGASSRAAAEHLGISETTVNTHRRNIMSKLELPSATHLVRYAIKHGYVKL